MKITTNDIQTGKIELPSLNQEIQMAGLEECDLKLFVEVFNKYFEEPQLDVNPPLHQCINCKKLMEIKRGDNVCKCGQGVYWSEV
jgi:hypothetical protein